ncbi:uncharacterized protein NECHADRAFT_87129 [Fusarium vanettenii 77-13-4]|uniref:Major facilitator superfamily (MFS) profile domain-containing protein n=1 Tax=Fusarium vanettenii (strain ATCC MYA-4622 / CBS 123669 / FGSC 9596 / NRRL 45880 / 77-13-4) TaxID=660122 RepID=C7ZIG0_FUSV7|nr:uncharacterized protein NECHADRAFT_87129 [Fusarium vanettenii 77-13-4]EEU36196.1 hypothetical protein NECHADRAFT_87129 [Fusarium vanettenii 77-13-4]
MEGYDTNRLNKFYAYPTFAKKYGHWNEANNNYQLDAAWQASLVNAATVGAFFGTLLNGVLLPRFGHIQVLIGALLSLSAFVFIVLFSPNKTVLMIYLGILSVLGVTKTLSSPSPASDPRPQRRSSAMPSVSSSTPTILSTSSPSELHTGTALRVLNFDEPRLLVWFLLVRSLLVLTLPITRPTSSSRSVSTQPQPTISTSVALAWVYSRPSCVGYLSCPMSEDALPIWGIFVMTILLMLIGGLNKKTENDSVAMAQAVLALIWTFVFQLSSGQLGWAILTEIGSTRLRQKTICLARNAYAIANIISGVLQSYFMNPTEWNLKGYTGFIWGGTSFFMFIWIYFRLPETKGRTFEELDLLFAKGVPARKFSTYNIETFRDTETGTEKVKSHASMA